MSALLTQLKAARTWLGFFVDELDLDPATTVFTVRAASPDGRRDEVAKVTLEQSLAQIDAAIAAAEEKATIRATLGSEGEPAR